MKAIISAMCMLCLCAPAAAQTPAAEPARSAQPAQPAAPGDDLSTSYRLGTGDEISVAVFNEPDLKVSQKIGAEGEISMPLLGDVRAAGLTPAQLASQLEDKFRGGYLLDPNVTVTVLTYRPFYVVGEVARPGAYPYAPDLTIAGAIATAGGFSKDAARGDVYLRRMGETDETKVKSAEAVSLRPGDTLRIGRSTMANFRSIPFGLLGLLP
jgi:polysaccharide export outer membrane protein